MLLEALSSPYVYSNVLFIIAGISFPIHLFGEYCILFKTPKVMKSVKWSLFDVHLWSSLMDLFLSFFVQPLAFFPVMAEFPMGVLNRIGMKTDVLMCSGVLIALLVLVSIIKMFKNRYYILFSMHTCWRYIRYSFLTMNYVLTILFVITVYVEIPEDQEFARSVLFKNNPELLQYDIPESPILVIAWSNFRMIYRQLLFTALFLSELIVFTVLIRLNMQKAISEIRSSASCKTFKIHRNFMKSLNMQIAVPIVVICIPSFFGLAVPFLQGNTQGAINFIYIIVSTHGALSTLIMVYLQKSYREAVVQIVGCNRKMEENIRTVMPKAF